ncbi:TraK domain-containing protein [Azotobacter beijerinckii]|uniref:Conjugal transfer pilus assembly protein TraK n=1 Tax=Azotobacter beijerinckii TaxID=170623 RepID=A0A1I4IZG2_9GAMM|nr:type-F conjugative transfer system secretin TraK [Azotobacter beijerinckii]SFL59146.1 conjugal transfer pilus assembly protein TraK [Azotobacter beijerinckii]
MRPTPSARPFRSAQRFRPAALLLAIAVAASHAADDVNIPGLNLPMAASELAPAAEAQVEPAQTERKSSARLAAAELPAVPAQVVAKPPAAPVPVETRQEVLVSPGANTLIPISRGQINRLVTPFERPIIQTVSGADITASGNALYVTPHSDQPITLFVTPEDDESIALSLTLLPQTMPPIQANLILAQNGPGGWNGQAVRVGALGARTNTEEASKWERSQPYMDTLRGILRDMALGTLPPGYSFGALPSGASIPACAQPGLKFDFSKSQLITGHDFRIFVAVAQNISSRTLEFDHGACTHPYRAAVSSWPHEILEPGQKTEVFLVTRVPAEAPDRSSRPSLLQ